MGNEFKGPSLRAGGNLEAGAQQRTERLAHLHQHAVAAGTQQALVEAQVVGDIVAPFFHRMLHAGERGLDVGDVLRGGTFGRQPHGRRLDHAAQVLQVTQELGGEPGLGLPGHDVRVKPVPVLLGQHPGAHLGAGADHALGHQRLDGLAHHRPAHAQFLAQQGLGRQWTRYPAA
jgi:hypothetical protein